ncbi:MAG: DUF47 domain-containing protein [Woeseia sp.]
MKLFSKGALGREKQIQEKFDLYLDGLGEIGNRLREAIASYLDQDERLFADRLEQIDAQEHQLDEIRRDIEMQIYGRRLLPDTRDDVLRLLERLDNIPDRIQSVARSLMLQRAEIPASVKSDLRQLTNRIVEAIRILIDVTCAFLDRPAEVRKLAGELSEIEHQADLVEHRAVALAFDAPDRELAHKLQLEGLIGRLGSVCDQAEDIGDRLVIASLKRVL